VLRATRTAGGLRPECLPCGAAINVGRPYPRLVGAISVFSNVQVTPEQLAWLMDQFKAQRQTYGDGWTIELGSGLTDAVGVADGSDDIAGMPPVITEPAAQ
jgi:hypothetical protein